jgi:hypothetical protein
MIRNQATPEGHLLGEHMVRLCDEAEPKARARRPDLAPRCASCAFRKGDHIPNGSPETLLTALKYALERMRFDCHEPGRVGRACTGWLTFTLRRDAPAHSSAMGLFRR